MPIKKVHPAKAYFDPWMPIILNLPIRETPKIREGRK
jgi:hypothetical protein